MPANERTDYTDAELLEQLSQDSAAAFAIIYNRYFSGLYAHAFKILKNSDICKDIIQDIFTQLWNKRRTQDIKALESYLHASTRFQVFRAVRSARNYEDLLDVTEELPVYCNTESVITVKDLAGVLYQGIDSLPRKCRAIFKMSRLEHLSNADIALRLSIAPKTVENQLTIALRKLRINFSDYLPVILVILHCYYK